AGEMRFTPTIATALLRVVDAIREMLAHIENSNNEGDGDYTALIAEIDRLKDAGDNGTTTSLPAMPELVIEKVVPIKAKPAPPSPPETSELLSGPLPTRGAVPMPLPEPQPPAPPSPPPEVASPPIEPAPSEPSEARASSMADTSIRVDVNLLDKLMTL